MRRGGADEGARLEARSRIPRRLGATALRHPGAVLAAWLLACLVAAPGVLRLQIETSTDSVLDLDSAHWEFYQESQLRFGGDEIISVMLEGESPLDAELLGEVVRLTGVFEALPGVRRVDSLATVPLVALVLLFQRSRFLFLLLYVHCVASKALTIRCYLAVGYKLNE